MTVYMAAEIGFADPTNAITNGQISQPQIVSTNELPSWWERVKRIEVGTRRAEAEAVLPINYASQVLSAGAVAGGRDYHSYYFSDGWTVTIGYDAPMGTKNGIRTWDYSSPDAKVIETPKISHRNIKGGEQGGPGYSAQGALSPDP